MRVAARTRPTCLRLNPKPPVRVGVHPQLAATEPYLSIVHAEVGDPATYPDRAPRPGCGWQSLPEDCSGRCQNQRDPQQGKETISPIHYFTSRGRSTVWFAPLAVPEAMILIVYEPAGVVLVVRLVPHPVTAKPVSRTSATGKRAGMIRRRRAEVECPVFLYQLR